VGNKGRVYLSFDREPIGGMLENHSQKAAFINILSPQKPQEYF